MFVRLSPVKQRQDVNTLWGLEVLGSYLRPAKKEKEGKMNGRDSLCLPSLFLFPLLCGQLEE